MADYAEQDDVQAPPELSLAWQVERWGAEAVIGKLIPARLLKRMTVAANVHAAFTSYKAGMYRLADWARSYPTYLKIVTDVIQMRRQQNA